MSAPIWIADIPYRGLKLIGAALCDKWMKLFYDGPSVNLTVVVLGVVRTLQVCSYPLSLSPWRSNKSQLWRRSTAPYQPTKFPGSALLNYRWWLLLAECDSNQTWSLICIFVFSQHITSPSLLPVSFICLWQVICALALRVRDGSLNTTYIMLIWLTWVTNS